MLSHNQVVQGVVVRGILPTMEDKVADFAKMMVSGELDHLVPANLVSLSAWNWRDLWVLLSATRLF